MAMTFLPMCIPLIAAIIVFYIWQHKIVWWEVLIPAGVSLIIAFGGKNLVETLQTIDTEYHTGWAVGAKYYEEWTEQVTEIYTDDKGHTHTRSYNVYHGPRYYVNDSNGYTVSIDYQTFLKFCRNFGNKTKKDILRLNQVSWGDGNMYYTVYKNQPEKFVPVTTTHSYENRIEVSNSTFKHLEVPEKTRKQYGIYEYPYIREYYQCPSILGNAPDKIKADHVLTAFNAKIGRSKQIRMWILLFKNQPLDAAIHQENYWDGGNKNELVLCIGTNNNNEVQWTYVFSWTKQERLKIDIRNFAREQKQFDLVAIVNYMVKEVRSQWKRREFAEFSYLTVTPPWWAIFLNFFFTGLVNIGIYYWAITNEFEG